MSRRKLKGDERQFVPSPGEADEIARTIANALGESKNRNPLAALAALAMITKEMGEILRATRCPQYMLTGMAALVRDVADFIEHGTTTRTEPGPGPDAN